MKFNVRYSTVQLLLPEKEVLGTMCHVMRSFQKKFVAILLLASMLLVAFWVGYPSLLGLLADHYYAQLSRADDAGVAELVDRLDALGDPAIPHLALALGSERKEVAQVVRAKLIEQIDTWEHPDTRPDSKSRLLLATSLAERMQHYGTSARLHAAGLAQRMIRVSDKGFTQKEASQLLLACEAILAGSKMTDEAEETDRLASQVGGTGRTSADHEAKGRDPNEDGDFSSSPSMCSSENKGNAVPLSERSLVDLVRLPGGNLPPAMPDLSSRRLSPEEGGGRETTPRSPSQGNPASGPFLSGEARSDAFADEDSTGENDEASGDGLSEEQGDGLRRLPENPALRPIHPSEEGESAVISPRYAALASGEPSSERIYSLIVELRSDDQKKIEKARRLLTDGGFKTVHFALAERLTDPDPTVRMELIRVLPRLKSVRSESWLKWLLKDDDSNIRHEALVTLASSSDPTLLAEVAQIAQSDSDPKIRLEGERIEQRLAR